MTSPGGECAALGCNTTDRPWGGNRVGIYIRDKQKEGQARAWPFFTASREFGTLVRVAVQTHRHAA
jgi:hypothetical protein